MCVRACVCVFMYVYARLGLKTSQIKKKKKRERKKERVERRERNKRERKKIIFPIMASLSGLALEPVLSLYFAFHSLIYAYDYMMSRQAG